MLSVNQLAAQVKLVEVWMALNDPKCPKQMTRKIPTEEGRTRSLRPGKRRDLVEECKTRLAKSSFGRIPAESGIKPQRILKKLRACFQQKDLKENTVDCYQFKKSQKLKSPSGQNLINVMKPTRVENCQHVNHYTCVFLI